MTDLDPQFSSPMRYEQNMLMRNRYGGASPGWASVGAAFIGNRANRRDSFLQGALEGARTNDAMQQARQRTAEAALKEAELQANTNLPQYMRAAGQTPAQSDLVSALFVGKHNPHEYSEYTGDMQKQDIQRKILDAEMAGNPELGNRLAAAFSGKPLELAKNEGGVNVAPYSPVGEQSMAPNELGQALIGERNARAAAAGSQGRAADALAAKRYGGMPAGVVRDASGVHGTLADGTQVNFDNTAPESVIQSVLHMGQQQQGKPKAMTSATEKLFRKPVMESDGKPALDAQHRPVYQDDPDEMAQFAQFASRQNVSPDQNAAALDYIGRKAQEASAPHGDADLAAMFAGKPVPQETAGKPKQVVRTGTLNGRKVIQYDDGSTEYAQ